MLCRCTGYRAIVEAVGKALGAEQTPLSEGAAVGRRLPRLDGARKLIGAEIYGADEWPSDALVARAVRSPHAHADFAFGDLDAYVAANPGVVAVFTAKDVPGENRFGVIPPFADQPALAEARALFRGEAVALVVGEEAAMQALDLGRFPVTFTPLPALTTLDAALAEDAPRLHANRPGNILTRGRVVRGDAEGGAGGVRRRG